jgi:hypothetical protein
MPDKPSSEPSLAAQWLIMLVVDHLYNTTSDVIADADTSMLRFVSSGRSKERRVLDKIEVRFHEAGRALVDCNKLASVALEAVRRALASRRLFVWYGSKDSVFDLCELKSPNIRSKYAQWLDESELFYRESADIFRYVGKTSQFLVMSDGEGAAADGHDALKKFLTSVETYACETTIPAPLTKRSEVLWLEDMDAKTIDALPVDGVRMIDASYVCLDADIRGALERLLKRACEAKTLRAVSLCGAETLDVALVKLASSALSPPCVAVSVFFDFYNTMDKEVEHVIPVVPPRSLHDSPFWIRSKDDLRRLYWKLIEAEAFLADASLLECS